MYAYACVCEGSGYNISYIYTYVHMSRLGTYYFNISIYLKICFKFEF